MWAPPLRCPPGQKCSAAPGGHVTIPPREGATAPRLGPLTVEGLRCVSTLSPRWERWATLAAPPWVLKTISRGYRLQFATVPPSICRFNRLLGSGRVGSCFAGGNPLTVKQRSNLCCTSRTVLERFLLQVFSGPQTEGERYSLYPGSTCSEQISQEIQVQDAKRTHLGCALCDRTIGSLLSI